MFYQLPSLTLSWNLIKEKKKENLSVWKSKVTSLIHALVFVSPVRSIKGFSGPEADGSVSRANSKINDCATNQMGIWTPAPPVAPETLQPADPSGPALAGMPPSAKNSLSLSLSTKSSRFGLQYRTNVCEMFFPVSLTRREAIFAHSPSRVNRALCKATHPHMVGHQDDAHVTQRDGKVSGKGLSSWLQETKYSLHGCRETTQNHC